jgi:hypothetical protein
MGNVKCAGMTAFGTTRPATSAENGDEVPRHKACHSPEKMDFRYAALPCGGVFHTAVNFITVYTCRHQRFQEKIHHAKK